MPWLLLASALLVTALIPVPAFGASERAPTELDIPSFHLGDAAVYAAEERLSVSFGAEVETTDAFGRIQQAILAYENTTETSTRIALNPATGTMFWSESEIDHDADRASEWVERRHAAYGLPWLFGATVVANKTLAPGDILTIPVYDGLKTHELSFSVSEPRRVDGVWWWPVEVGVDGTVSSTPRTGALQALPGQVLYFEADNPFPVARDSSSDDGTRLLRTSVTLDPQSEALPQARSPDRPWEQNPSVEFRESRTGPPPIDDEGFPDPFPLADALTYAEERADGLRAFLDSHPDAVFTEATFSQTAGSRIGFEPVPLVRNTWHTWTLEWATQEGNHPPNEWRSDGWYVRVEVQRMLVLGQETDREVYIDEEGPGHAFNQSTGPILSPQAIIDHAWDRMPDQVAGYALGDRVMVQRFGDNRGWSLQIRYSYSFLYTDPESASAFDGWVIMEADTGSFSTVEGTGEFLDAFDQKGPLFSS